MHEVVCFAENNVPWKMHGKGPPRNGWEMVPAMFGSWSNCPHHGTDVSRVSTLQWHGSVKFARCSCARSSMVFCNLLANRSGVAASRLPRLVLVGFPRFLALSIFL